MIFLTDANSLTDDEAERLLRLLRMPVAHTNHVDGETCAACTARAKLERAKAGAMPAPLDPA